MGIHNLLQILTGIVETKHLSEFAGQTIAVDTYCWLHKAGSRCASEICQNVPTDYFVKFCMARVDLLRQNGVTPILVFDGRHLPAKEGKERERATSRKYNLLKAQQLMRAGNKIGAEQLFQRSVDITPTMAYEVIRALRKENLQYIVAPYEADAQLAYLYFSGLASAVITEDSDLLAFGVEKVIVKLDKTGYGQFIDFTRRGELREYELGSLSQEQFQMMCILSGCDYLPSLRGMGIKTAYKLVKTYKTEENIMAALPSYVSASSPSSKLKIPQIHAANASMQYISSPSSSPLSLSTSSSDIPSSYPLQFHMALLTFKHQTVFCPKTRRLRWLQPMEDGSVCETERLRKEKERQANSSDRSDPSASSSLAPLKGKQQSSLFPSTLFPALSSSYSSPSSSMSSVGPSLSAPFFSQSYRQPYDFLGPFFSNRKAFLVSLGELDPFTLTPLGKRHVAIHGKMSDPKEDERKREKADAKENEVGNKSMNDEEQDAETKSTTKKANITENEEKDQKDSFTDERADKETMDAFDENDTEEFLGAKRKINREEGSEGDAEEEEKQKKERPHILKELREGERKRLRKECRNYSFFSNSPSQNNKDGDSLLERSSLADGDICSAKGFMDCEEIDEPSSSTSPFLSPSLTPSLSLMHTPVSHIHSPTPLPSPCSPSSPSLMTPLSPLTPIPSSPSSVFSFFFSAKQPVLTRRSASTEEQQSSQPSSQSSATSATTPLAVSSPPSVFQHLSPSLPLLKSSLNNVRTHPLSPTRSPSLFSSSASNTTPLPSHRSLRCSPLVSSSPLEKSAPPDQPQGSTEDVRYLQNSQRVGSISLKNEWEKKEEELRESKDRKKDKSENEKKIEENILFDDKMTKQKELNRIIASSPSPKYTEQKRLRLSSSPSPPNCVLQSCLLSPSEKYITSRFSGSANCTPEEIDPLSEEDSPLQSTPPFSMDSLAPNSPSLSTSNRISVITSSQHSLSLAPSLQSSTSAHITYNADLSDNVPSQHASQSQPLSQSPSPSPSPSQPLSQSQSLALQQSSSTIHSDLSMHSQSPISISPKQLSSTSMPSPITFPISISSLSPPSASAKTAFREESSSYLRFLEPFTTLTTAPTSHTSGSQPSASLYGSFPLQKELRSSKQQSFGATSFSFSPPQLVVAPSTRRQVPASLPFIKKKNLY
ncbi:Exonuclease 1 [Monocercomonoides exilis]|uniref:Exonuclease 1 n=1 Tax=Monocercomonoides exilis TaxID=2049356 RepID=UPI00355A556E|nr:Exonuclease 1 [Monocercomonoides exilis]|eukprot:MONOS_7415.1-p1 / transcript=MONOS_7415.1 / gene=MONOS_7415 / organism=Monocercomonoides_exilis_PA203 / gene_product=Exonuclease 1 / transcript_product=Exonuclease 1 / location=Mono_scaffold00252:59823-63393(-) / protein_length=1169 / sequence_SO=supercontig / SO=protein_coding / is_pseudo=false